MALGITDIDDKIIARAASTRPDIRDPNTRCRDLASFFEQDFVADMNVLGVKPPAVYLRVSEHIPEIIQFISVLLKRGLAYEAEGDVYFDTYAFTAQGNSYPKMRPNAMSAISADAEDAGVGKSKKHRAADFVLWKRSTTTTDKSASQSLTGATDTKTAPQVDVNPVWNAPWGPGRPGWHIECSANCQAIFGQSLDLHTGGIDLQFPHHSNEVAQSEAHGLCCTSELKPAVAGDERSSSWCRLFLHSGHLHIDGRKMSKSLKNFITIKDFLANRSPDVMRMFCLQHRYSSGIELTEQVFVL